MQIYRVYLNIFLKPYWVITYILESMNRLIDLTKVENSGNSNSAETLNSTNCAGHNSHMVSLKFSATNYMCYEITRKITQSNSNLKNT